jgi:hypothetical protein
MVVDAIASLGVVGGLAILLGHAIHADRRAHRIAA